MSDGDLRGLLRRLSKQDGRRIEQDGADLFRDPALPLYELVRWEARRFIGGSAGDGGDVSALTLAFADLDDAGPQVRITTSAGGVEQARSLTDELDTVLGTAIAVDSNGFRANADDTAGSTVTIPVDGSPVTFEVLSRAEHWAARADIDGHVVLIAARGVDRTSVELRRVADTEPYILGWAEFQQAKWGLAREE